MTREIGRIIDFKRIDEFEEMLSDAESPCFGIPHRFTSEYILSDLKSISIQEDFLVGSKKPYSSL